MQHLKRQSFDFRLSTVEFQGPSFHSSFFSTGCCKGTEGPIDWRALLYISWGTGGGGNGGQGAVWPEPCLTIHPPGAPGVDLELSIGKMAKSRGCEGSHLPDMGSLLKFKRSPRLLQSAIGLICSRPTFSGTRLKGQAQ